MFSVAGSIVGMFLT